MCENYRWIAGVVDVPLLTALQNESKINLKYQSKNEHEQTVISK